VKKLSRFEKTFQKLKKEKRKAVVPFLVLGDPSLSKSEYLLKRLIDAGVDGLELGIPFTDPIADGPTVQQADLRAFKSGVTPINALALVKRMRAYAPGIPIGLLVYYNIIVQIGVERFCHIAGKAGADAVLSPDVPLEEIVPLRKACLRNNLDNVMLVTLTTANKRLKRIARAASGFLYLVSVLGVTGARKTLPKRTIQLVRRAKRTTRLPILVGFGISNQAQYTSVCRAGADGAIVGSAIIRNIENELNFHAAVGKAVALVKKLKKASKSG